MPRTRQNSLKDAAPVTVSIVSSNEDACSADAFVRAMPCRLTAFTNPSCAMKSTISKMCRACTPLPSTALNSRYNMACAASMPSIFAV